MKCKNPYMLGVVPVGCGQCMFCRINRRRIWTARMLLESFKHDGSLFVTLTYNDENIPKSGSLEKRDVQKWIKRLRRAITPKKIRYFLVGEYGDETSRPHYHAAIFGMEFTEENCNVIDSTWGLGNVYVGLLEKKSAQYIGGYILKKMTGKNDERLDGREPEFARMSLRPGLGRAAMDDLIEQIGPENMQKLKVMENMPSILKMGKDSLVLGRYLSKYVREKANVSEDQVKAFADAMRELYKNEICKEENKKKSWKQVLIDKNRQSMLNQEKRMKIFAKERLL